MKMSCSCCVRTTKCRGIHTLYKSLVTYFISQFHSHFIGYSSCNTHGCNPARLCTAHFLIVLAVTLQSYMYKITYTPTLTHIHIRTQIHCDKILLSMCMYACKKYFEKVYRDVEITVPKTAEIRCTCKDGSMHTYMYMYIHDTCMWKYAYLQLQIGTAVFV